MNPEPPSQFKAISKPVTGFDLRPTPDPNKWVVAFTTLIAGDENIVQNMPISAWNTEGKAPTTYAQFCETIGINANVDQFGTQVYTQAEKGGPGEITFLFAPAAASDDQIKPYLEVPSFGAHPWPPILHSLAVPLDTGLPLAQSSPDLTNGGIGTTFAPQPYVRETFTPGIDGGTRFIKRYFWNATPMQIGRYPIPIPESVSYDLPGNKSGQFPECLHSEIVIDDQQTAPVQVVTAGTQVGGQSIEGQIFPATNFETWETYTPEFSQEMSAGGFLAVQTIVQPPDAPDPITRDQ